MHQNNSPVSARPCGPYPSRRPLTRIRPLHCLPSPTARTARPTPPPPAPHTHTHTHTRPQASTDSETHATAGQTAASRTRPLHSRAAAGNYPAIASVVESDSESGCRYDCPSPTCSSPTRRSSPTRSPPCGFGVDPESDSECGPGAYSESRSILATARAPRFRGCSGFAPIRNTRMRWPAEGASLRERERD